MKRLFILLAAAFLANTALAQEVKIMQIIKNDVVDFEIPVLKIDSIVFSSISDSLDGVVIGGVRWATRNLDFPGTFAPYPHSAGRFYQWGTMNGVTHHWSATETVTGWNNSTNRVAWTSANDPCPEGWRVPTSTELNNLRSQFNFWTTKNGVNGRVFGIPPNQIFLPAAGFRSGSSGTLFDVGWAGYYWSRNAYGTGRALGVLFYSDNGWLFGWQWQSYGLSVRCVAE